MKKLLIALMSVASFALVAKATSLAEATGTSFELEEGVEFDVGEFTPSGDYWATAAEAVGEIATEGVSEIMDRPEMFLNKTQAQYLKVATADAFTRYAQADGSEVEIGSGVYFDSLVQFTAGETARKLTDGAKLAIWLKAGEEETDPATLMVSAGVIEDGAVSETQKDYEVSMIGGGEAAIEAGSWHRVTVKAISNIFNNDSEADPVVGFVVFIDRGLVAVEGTGLSADELTLTAADWFAKGALIPSFGDAQTITGVSFVGEGAVDDLSFTPVAPEFAADKKYFTLNWNPLDFVSLSINDEELNNDGSESFVFTGADDDNVFVLTYELDDSMAPVAVTGVTCSAGVTYAGGTFTATDTAEATIGTQLQLFKVGSEYFDDIYAAIAAADGDPVQLNADIEADVALVVDNETLVLDLAGHSISVDDTTDFNSAIYGINGASVTIIDSVGGGVIDGNGNGAVYLESGMDGGADLTIGAATGDVGAMFDDTVDCDGDLVIVRGKFLAEACGKPGEAFGELAEGSTVSEDVDENGYWVVTPGDTPVVDSYVVSWSVPVHAMVSATVDGAEIINGKEVEDGKEVVFVVTPEEGYEFAGEEYEGWELDDDSLTCTVTVKGAAVSLEIPEATEIPATTVQISLPAATEGVTGYIVSNVTDGVAIAADVQEEPVIGGVTYTLPIDAEVEIWVVPADGYRVTGNPYVIEKVTTETTVDVKDLPSVEAIAYVAEIVDGDKFETLQAAIAAAETGDTVTLLADLAQTESIEVEGKDITFDLNGKTLTFNVSGDGFYFFNDADCSVKNGTIVMNVPATANWYSAIYFEDAGGLVKDVTINSGNCKYGVVTGVDDYESLEGTADKTVVCENVDVTGSGLLFYAEAEKMTLDADCSATQIGTNPAGATYSDALAAGWLGQLTVNGGEYTAEANVVGTMSSPATITLNAGTYSGNFNYVPVSEGYKEMGDHVITKAEEVELAAPAGYAWSVADESGMQQLVKTYAVTYSLAAGVRAVVSNETTAAVATYDGPATNSFMVSAGDTIYVEYSSLEAGYEPTVEGGSYMITDNKTLLPVELDPIVYDITYHDATVTNGVMEYTIETATFALPTAENGVEAQDGANFIGWTNALGQTVTEVTPGTTTGDLDFYAVWEPVVGPSWDIPGANGGINALVKEDGVTKYVEFTSVALTDTGATVGLHAAKIDANGETFGLVCKTDLTKDETFILNAVLSYEKGELGDATEGLFTITADLSGYTQLFVVGVGPEKKPE